MAGELLLIGTERCGTCKFQKHLPDTPYGNTPMCMRYPPARVPIVITLPGPPDAAGAPTMQVQVRHEMTIAPAPDNFGCGEWKPRVLKPA